jgi:membrane-bound ClpP family serine protease
MAEVEERLAACPARQQAAITGGVLFLLILLGFFAAQFGWIGILLYWMTLVLIVR